MAVRIGSHVSSAGGAEATAERAAAVGCQTLQIFTSSPRQWRAPAADPSLGEVWRRLRRQHHLTPLVVHANYLINVAADNPELQTRSRAALRGELERAVAIGADYLVLHPGSGEREACVKGIRAAAAGLEWKGLELLIENMAGGGKHLAGRFDGLAAILDDLGELPVKACIDTCHAWAAGYDWLAPGGYERTLRELADTVGLARVPVFHANDAKSDCGSHHDRHAHVGKGKLGRGFFRQLLRDKKLQGRAFLVETPPEGQAADVAGLQRLAQ